jgi:hypothetical protein
MELISRECVCGQCHGAAFATVPSTALISTDLSNFAKRVVASDNVLDIYLQTNAATVNVGGGGFGNQAIKALSMSEDLQKFIKDTFLRLEPLINLDFNFTSSKDSADLHFYVDSEIKVGGSGTTLGIALFNSSRTKNWWEIALNGPALANQPDYLRYAIIHEFGHAMGLEHPFDNSDGDYYGGTNPTASAYPEDTVMAYRAPQNGSWPTWYSANDITALQAIWGVKVSIVQPTTIPVFRLLNKTNGSHFYTSSHMEKDVVTGSIYSDEGVVFNAPANGDQPLYRLFRSKTGSHFYTASTEEKDSLLLNKSWGFAYEGIAFNVYSPINAPTGSIPVHRLFNSSNSQHLFTTNNDERNAILADFQNWKYEGVAFFV